MREIKFRVHNEETGEVLAYETFNGCINWGYHYVLAKELETLKGEAICHAPPEYFKHPHPFGKLRRVLFTGRKDKNGVEIYVGDIIRAKLGERGQYLETMGEIVYDAEHGSFANRNEAGNTLLCDILRYTIEVIGNIHEHPHLLEAADA